MFQDKTVVIKGGGDLASAVAHKMKRSGFKVIITEIPCPKMVRRTVSFGNAIYEGEWSVEGETSKHVNTIKEAAYEMDNGRIPVIIDPDLNKAKELKPTVVIDATLAKRNIKTSKDDAPIVIGLGPGFTAPENAHAVIETKRGHDLGRIILEGSSIPNTGIPGNIEGYTHERVFRAPKAGLVKNCVKIGDIVEKDHVLCYVDDAEVKAKISGVVRGLIHDGLMVNEGEKLGDVDPRGNIKYCYTISDKGRTIAGGVLEATLYFLNNM
ncbi:MAG TPA: EF2563 family selenium-dependent molybdenum hydroxylase system protein [Thermoanaerobacterales bacterium]|jgi:xanthine dehydrogenase accessory factor|nr:EF2563 family selenium-dependent molybdenum hydroxylase system protein [Thermoanaerobacterales bacterium]